MLISPIIPIWIMILICAILIRFISKNKKRSIRQIIIIIILFIINLRIMILDSNVKIEGNNIDVLFVIDNTISMLAEDYNGENTRLSAVKKDCKLIINRLNGANFSVITFNNSSRIAIPYTKDTDIAIETIQLIKPINEKYAYGTTINTPLEDMRKILQVSKSKTNRKRIVFFISDGEITKENEKLMSYDILRDYIDDGAVLGYGTNHGGKMQIVDEYTGKKIYVKDKTDNTYGISKIDENNLQELANSMKVDYINMEKQSNIDYKLTEIKKKEQGKDKEKQKKASRDIYYIFVLPLMILLVYEFIDYKKTFLGG